MKLKGKIEKQEITSYQYGTYRLITDTTFYALRSGTVNLDSFKEKNVMLWGRKIDGYPVEGGPVYLEVDSVQSIR